MISIKEKRILDKFKKIYETKITNKNIEYINDYKDIIIDDSTFNSKMTLKFLNDLTEEEKINMIYHSIFHAQNIDNDYEFIKQITKCIKKYGKNLNKFDNKIIYKMILHTLKFIELQQDILINPDSYIKFNKKYSNYFNKINYCEITSLPTLYRKILKIVLSTNDDYVKTLDEIFNTNKYDILIMKYLNGTDINIFKNYLTRLIYFDSYILLKNELLMIIEQMKSLINDINEDDLANVILEYINYSIKNNIFKIPNNNEMKKELFYAFLDFFLDVNDKETKIKNVEDSNEKELRLLNPLYKIDEY